MEREMLPHELLLPISVSLWQSLYLDVFTLMRWHRCSHELYGPRWMPSWNTPMHCVGRYRVAVNSKVICCCDAASFRWNLARCLSALSRVAWPLYLSEVPSKKYSLALLGINLDEIRGLCFEGGTNADALRTLSHCAAWVQARYN